MTIHNIFTKEITPEYASTIFSGFLTTLLSKVMTIDSYLSTINRINIMAHDIMTRGFDDDETDRFNIDNLRFSHEVCLDTNTLTVTMFNDDINSYIQFDLEELM